MEITSGIRKMTFPIWGLVVFFYFFICQAVCKEKQRAASSPLGVMDQRPRRSPVPVCTCSLIMMQETYLNKLLFVIKVNCLSDLKKSSLTALLVKELSVVQLCAEERRVSIPRTFFLLMWCCTSGEFNAWEKKKRFNIKNSPEHKNPTLRSHKQHHSNHINIMFFAAGQYLLDTLTFF